MSILVRLGIIGAVVLGLGTFMEGRPNVDAAPGFPRGQELSAARCDSTGAPVINVVQKVVGDVDSGEAGNYWAFDSFARHIQVWDQGGGAYCAIVQYDGKFDAQAGETSPGAGDVLDGDEDGTFHGGYRAIITGDLLDSPTWKTRGSVGTFDYGCDLAGNCPGYVSWIDQYFEPGSGFDYEWWGWTYRAGKHGTWINSADGNSGDIS